MDLVGKTLGHFEVTQELGKGGMATVYKAYQANLQRYVAIKVLLPSLAEDMDLVKRFLREAQSAAALHHPNVITIHDVGSEEQVHYIVMEYLEGMTLAELLTKETALSPERIVNVLRQIANALDYAHTKGYIHRDIKPSNIMIDPDRKDHITLMDFGLVRATTGSRLTRTGFIMGTPDYMSPEQARGDALDRRSDIYSLGVMLYHMFTGNVPFVKPTPHAVLLAHLMDEPPPMIAPSHNITPVIEAVVRKSMAKDPNQRYDWAGDLVADLETAVMKPDTFIMPPMEDLMAPYQSKTIVSSTPQTPPSGMPTYPQPTPARGATPYPQTPPPGYYPQTPSGGVTPYPQTPPSGYVYPQTPAGGVAAPPKKRRWVIPVVILAFALIAALVVGGVLFLPSILDRFNPTPTVAVAMNATSTSTPEPKIELFAISPQSVVQGDSVTIEWRVSGADSVDIEPNIRQDAPASGSIVDKPLGTTTYELILPGGERQSVTVEVAPAPGAPEIVFFASSPLEAVRGQEVELAWQVTGNVASIEIYLDYAAQPKWSNLPALGTLRTSFDKPSTVVLLAQYEGKKSTQTISINVLEPTATATTAPTPEPTATPTEVPPTPTPIPTATPTSETSASTPASTPTKTATKPPTQPSTGALISFETFGTWRRGDQPYGEFTQSSEQVKSGSYAGKLVYNFSSASAGDDFVIFEQKTAVSGEPNQVSVWVYGDGSGHFFNLWVLDAEGEMWAVAMGRIYHTGWQKMTGTLAPGLPWPNGHVYGPDNSKVDYPVRFSGIVIDRADGAKTGTLYFDDIAFLAGTVAQGTPVPGATATPVMPASGEVGRIIFTVQEGDNYYLYSTDPAWSNPVEIGRTTYANSTCPEGNREVRTMDGKSIPIKAINVCLVAGTVGSCPAPNGAVKANTSNVGDGNFAVTLVRASDGQQLRSYYIGKLYIWSGLNWAPDSSHFLFTDQNMGVIRAEVDEDGYKVILGVKYNDWPLQFTPDGSYVYYLKLVAGANADVFVIRSDGTGERNITNAPISKKMCPRWKGP
ncbi:MAG: protein kinase [Anaerolineae bacterium]|nr:protein kinase [Anaerolineae bacterium]